MTVFYSSLRRASMLLFLALTSTFASLLAPQAKAAGVGHLATAPIQTPTAQSNGKNEEDDWVLVHLDGVVHDADRKPIAGARVSLTGTYGYYQTRANSPATNRGVSDGSGKYRLSFYTKRGTSTEILGIKAQAKGYLLGRADFPTARPVIRPGAPAQLNFQLVPGEVLAGVVSVPERLSDRLEGEKLNERLYVFRVSSGTYTETFATEPGGAFAVWVPKGTYRLELLRGEAVLARLENVATGTQGLKLRRVDPPIAEGVLARAFDALWSDMAQNYSYFELKKVDWGRLKAKYRARAVAGGTLPGFVDVLGEMLGELRDGHVWFAEPEDAVVAFRPPEQRWSINVGVVEAAMKDAAWIGNGFARVGTTTPDGFGVVWITRQSRADEASAKKVAEFIRAHAGVPGFIVDLRGADGGNELLAHVITREFCAAATVYAKSKYRNGPKPTDFGEVYDRILEPSEKPFTKPVVCILGPGCVSSGEALAKMMVCLPNVTSVGLPTRGSSGNPRPFKLPGVPVTVLYSRWVDMTPDGQKIEDRGVQPRIRVDLPNSAFKERDPIWEKAIATLRQKVKEGK